MRERPGVSRLALHCGACWSVHSGVIRGMKEGCSVLAGVAILIIAIGALLRVGWNLVG